MVEGTWRPVVVLVVFVFLGSWRATIIPLLAVPVAIIGTFAVMMALGFSANTVSLLALAVVGLAVALASLRLAVRSDDAVLVELGARRRTRDLGAPAARRRAHASRGRRARGRARLRIILPQGVRTFVHRAAHRLGPVVAGRGRRRRGADIRYEIRNGRINFMPDGGNQRNGAISGGPYDDFFIEAPQILHRPAAACHDEEIGSIWG